MEHGAHFLILYYPRARGWLLLQSGQDALGKEMTKLEKEIVSRKAEASSKKSALVMMHRAGAIKGNNAQVHLVSHSLFSFRNNAQLAAQSAASISLYGSAALN